MSTRTKLVGLFLGVIAPFAKGEVVVELVPDNPGPYTGGESLTVDVWLHSQVSFDVLLELIQFDFSDTDPAISLDPTFTFDYSSIPNDSGGYNPSAFCPPLCPSDDPLDPLCPCPALPVPWTWNGIQCVCPEAFLPLPEGGSLHIGSVGLQLPTEPGAYRLDVLNADEPDKALGARLTCHLTCSIWRAFTGEIIGGAYDFVVSYPPMPTLSEWGMVIMTLLLLGAGSIIIVRTKRRASLIAGISAGALLLGATARVIAQPAPIPSQKIAITVDSGFVSPRGAGTDPVVVFSHMVGVPEAPWIRLHFQQVQLSGSPASGDESFLRITATQDGGAQVLRSRTLTQWRNTTGYFNGDSVLVELLAYANTGANRVVIDAITVGVQGDDESTAGVCTPEERISSGDPRAGRMMPIGCTGFLFNNHPRGLLTAGHCCWDFDFVNDPPFIEFQVPDSLCNGTPQPASPDDQYPIDADSVQLQSTGIGNDWCYFGVFDNSNTGLSPLEAQAGSYRLAKAVPAGDGNTLRMTGYGIDITPPGCCDAPACTTCGSEACGYF